MRRRVQVRYEQAVYGSFPFWDRGYAVLAQSPGCRPEWLAGLRAACQRYGERPAGVAEAGGLFALRLPRGPWMVVGVGPQGRDDRGRPGALAFHALFVDPRDYRRAGYDPFALAGALRNDWDAGTRALPAGSVTVEPRVLTGPSDSRAARIAAALMRGRRVALESPGPIDTLARQAWLGLPPAVRGRASVATWAYGNGNRFDLLALPRLAGAELDASYVGPAEIDAEDGLEAYVPEATGPGKGRLRRAMPFLGVAALLIGAGLGLALRPGDEGPAAVVTAETTSPPDRGPPDPAAYRADPAEPEEVRRVAEALADLAERFGVLQDPGPGRGDPAALMALLSDRLRYRGPWLSAAERARIASEAGAAGRDPALALEWDARAMRFAPDRPLPEDFARGPLRWQLDTLLWSYHLDDDPDAPHRSPAEVPHALADFLAVDVPLRDISLSAQYPALAAYREFLGRLPRR